MSSVVHWKWRSICVFLLLVVGVVGICEKKHLVGLWLPPKAPIKSKHVTSQNANQDAEYQMVVKGRLAEVQACYNTELKKGLINRQGKLVLHWAVDATGHTSDFEQELNEMDSPELYDCTVKSITNWPFPKKKNLMIRYTFNMRELVPQRAERQITSLEDLGQISSEQEVVEETTD